MGAVSVVWIVMGQKMLKLGASERSPFGPYELSRLNSSLRRMMLLFKHQCQKRRERSFLSILGFRSLTHSVGLLMLFGGAHSSSWAEVLLTMTETTEGISIVARGQANVRGLSFASDGLVANSDFAFHFGSGMVRTGDVRSTRARTYTKVSGPTSFGNNEDGREVFGEGDVVGVLPRRGLLVMPAGYQSGTSVFGTVDYPGLKLEDLGIDLGVYRWTWGAGGNRDSLVVRVDSNVSIPQRDRSQNLIQNGSFEESLHPWGTEPELTPRSDDAAIHGDSYLHLAGGRYVEQVLNLFPGRYVLDFAFGAGPNLPTSSLSVLLIEQSVSFPGLVDQEYEIAGNLRERFWRYRSVEFEVPERVGSRFRQLTLRFSPHLADEMGEGLNDLLLDDVQLYRLDEDVAPLLRLRSIVGWPDRLLVEVARPGTVRFEFSDNLRDWELLPEGLRVLNVTDIFKDKRQGLGKARYYRGRFESSIQLPLAVPPPLEHRLVWIEPASFVIGTDDSDPDRDPDEGPLTTVHLTKRYAIGIHEVTQMQYEELMKVNPSRFRFDPTHPVTNMRWSEAMEFCRRLTDRERRAGTLPQGYEYRLPTEAEWDYACQAGEDTRYHYGDDPDYSELGEYAWYSENSDGVSHPVMTRKPNNWGIFDMHGSVHEWCLDQYGPYPGGEISDPIGPEREGRRLHVIRGGSWLDAAKNCRRSDRHRDWFETYVGDLGFRVALAPARE